MVEKRQLDKKKVVLGLSGGVDSTAAALILKEKGFEVIGVFFNIAKEDDVENYLNAKKVAEELGIKLHLVNVNKEFETIVIGNFLEEYKNGRTPNPCVVCNPNVKFKVLTDIADKEGAYHIATGHYARIIYSHMQQCYTVQMGENHRKDQSYMLYRVPQRFVKRLIFPLGNIEDKSDTRKFVKNNHISNHDKKDSQEICFIADDENYTDFLKDKGINFEYGNFVDLDGNVLGRHKGIANYTVGQRKGLGIALGKPAFVVKIDKERNEVVLGDNDDLFTDEVIITNAYFQCTDSNALPKDFDKLSLVGKIRYKSPLTPCKLERVTEDKIKVVFSEKQRAVAKGQSLVLYLGEEIFGGGIIA